MRLVLASASPRRREFLARLGLSFDVVPSALDESLPAGLDARAAAERLALAKAWAVAAGIRPPRGARAVVLGADTLVILGARLFGKPASPAEARAMLMALRGRAHEVVTGVAVVEVPTGREATATVVSRVVMRRYAPGEVAAYLATGEPHDKAGAYAVQGKGGRLVARVEGCYTNVVGLPLEATVRLLRAFGLPVADPPPAGLRAPAARSRGGLAPRRRTAARGGLRGRASGSRATGSRRAGSAGSP